MTATRCLDFTRDELELIRRGLRGIALGQNEETALKLIVEINEQIEDLDNEMWGCRNHPGDPSRNSRHKEFMAWLADRQEALAEKEPS